MPVHPQTPVLRSVMSNDCVLENVLVSGFSEEFLLKLLGRSEAEIDRAVLAQSVQGKRILITGGGGSIGLALAQHILSLSPARLVLLDQSEAAVLVARKALCENGSVVCEVVLGRVGPGTSTTSAYVRESFDTVFHAAAYKHLDALENDPLAAITNNVLGAWHCLSVANGTGVERFVLISTDKAHRPSSVLGESKYLAERLLLGGGYGDQIVVSALRFGNVLGSSGSVLEIFCQRLLLGEPLRITDKDAARFFLTPREVSGYLLQVAAIGEGGLYVAESGDAVKITELARRLVAALDMDFDSVLTEYTGLKPGEKLTEQMCDPDEAVDIGCGSLKKVRVADSPAGLVEQCLADLQLVIESGDQVAAREVLCRYVTKFLEY